MNDKKKTAYPIPGYNGRESSLPLPTMMPEESLLMPRPGQVWLFPYFYNDLSLVILAIAQEISAPTGAVTGRGLSDLIREHYGVKWTFFAMSVLLIANLGTTVSEFSGLPPALKSLESVNISLSRYLPSLSGGWLLRLTMGK